MSYEVKISRIRDEFTRNERVTIEKFGIINYEFFPHVPGQPNSQYYVSFHAMNLTWT
jgi:hypothetical protein